MIENSVLLKMLKEKRDYVENQFKSSAKVCSRYKKMLDQLNETIDMVKNEYRE